MNKKKKKNYNLHILHRYFIVPLIACRVRIRNVFFFSCVCVRECIIISVCNCGHEMISQWSIVNEQRLDIMTMTHLDHFTLSLSLG